MSARIRTGYSFRNAVGRIDQVIARLEELGKTTAPITDTCSAFGWVRWSKATAKKNMRPVFGVELAVTHSIHEKKPTFDYWTFISKDSLKPIHELIGTASEQFRYHPLLTVDQALSKKGVNKIIGHRSAVADFAPSDDLYVGLGPATTKGYINRALTAGHRLIAVSDNRYPALGGQSFYEVTCGRTASTQSYLQHILSDDEWRALPNIASFDLELALANRDAVLAQSTAVLGKAEIIHPERPMTLEAMCREGAKKLNCDLANPEYEARMMRELNLIQDKEFEDYFYLVADICQWARKRMIVGPARGSSCGSLVCYLLGITSIDPIPFGLIFERFIDINRSDLPDIDIDFSETKREQVFEYVRQKYGKERVARLGTVAMFQPRSALNESAGALDIPPWELKPVLDSIVERSSGDARALQATEDTLKDTQAGRDFLAKYPEILIAAQMEGHPRHAGQHAAGIVITQTPLSDVVTVDHRTGATHCDKKDAEDLNLLKIDALGLTQLSIFEDALELANLPQDHLFKVPYDDDEAFKVLRDHKYAGIFQFNGLALQSITDQVEVTHLNDIVAITALGRPGPLNTGGTMHWVRVKAGKLEETYPHPTFEPHLKDTKGVVAYQEQVMTIGREIGDLSWEDVTALRKAMSKSLGKEFFDQYGDRWKAGARAKGIPEEVLTKIWDDLCAYGSWAFNKSHAVAYGVISYWCCWLKAHYPLEFAAATLTYTDSPETQIKLLRELAVEGVEYTPADIDLSTDRWTVGSKGNSKMLVGPLSNVHGVGPKMQSEIISARARGEPLSSRAQKLLTDPKTKIDSLFPIKDRFAEIMPDPTVRNIFTPPVKVIEVQANGEFNREVLVFCTLENIKPKDENEAINVAKRGYAINDGKTAALNLRLADDTDVVFAKVDRFNFEAIGRPMLERGRAGKALYAIKGTVPKDFRMIKVTAARYIGDLELDAENVSAQQHVSPTAEANQEAP